MNKKIISILFSPLIVFSSLASADYLMKFSNSQSKGMIPEASSLPLYSSCKKILDNGQSTGNGVYSINVNNKEFDVYCDMTSAGGGWTMVVAQFEQDPVNNWNESIQEDYDPSLSTRKGFALSSQELPEHTQAALGKDFDADYVDYVDYIYTTGDISRTVVSGKKGGKTYHIHRNESAFHSGYNPESSIHYDDSKWFNALTLDELNGFGFDWAFGPNVTSSFGIEYRGYSMLTRVMSSFDNYAWTVWVR